MNRVKDLLEKGINNKFSRVAPVLDRAKLLELIRKGRLTDTPRYDLGETETKRRPFLNLEERVTVEDILEKPELSDVEDWTLRAFQADLEWAFTLPSKTQDGFA